MLATYAKAVAAMKAKPDGDPLSWTFQWYTHFVNGPQDMTGKSNEINRIYGTQPSDNRSLAEAAWSTCQSHLGQLEDNFLPWHRMYVYYFEQIIRQVSGDPTFTLPYWDYTDPRQQAVPPEFRMPDDPVFKSLFQESRTLSPAGNVNSGAAITAANDAPAAALNLLAMRARSYSGDTGFCSLLDSSPHGLVHVFTGTDTNMGAVPTAAGDPVFWIHHSNIDRIWASWNAAGRENPTDPNWLSSSFTFAGPDGKSVQPVIKDFLDTAALGYTYDALLKPPAPTFRLNTAAGTQAPSTLFAARGGPLGRSPLRVKLERSAPVGGATSVPSLKTAAGSRQMFLKLMLSATAQPNMIFNVYLGMPPEKEGTPQSSAYYVGTIGFFDVIPHAGHGGGAPTQKVRYLDITEQLASLKKQGLLRDEPPSITFLPSDEPAVNSNPAVGDMALLVR
ncbi:MAG: tyrosinase family protein [Hyalangium sp.]|uniref:tyrosinase family protein n=1 Tax=Hyalangium sp. TaxID=2028555 RepID=UPI00389A9E9A